MLVSLAAGWYALLPPPARVLDTSAQPGLAPHVRGAFHVHTNRSDGTGTVDAVAAAAARAGLTFVVLTDHGDGTRDVDPPRYRDGVLTIDAVEISTDGGHVIALGMPKAPFPLGGETRDVLEDIERLGGFAIVAHPGSAKPELRWTDWSGPIAGLEWLNGDSEWRDESPWLLIRALLTYPGRQVESLGTLLDRPAEVLQQWDALTRERRIVAVAAADAHARIGLGSIGEPYATNTQSLHIPSYEESFRAFSNALPHVVLNGDPQTDARAIADEIRAGHLYSVVDAIAAPAMMSFTARSQAGEFNGGDVLAPSSGDVALRVTTNAPGDARIVLLKDGMEAATANGAVLEHTAGGDVAVYRVEIHLPGAPGLPLVPWMLSNPIYVARPPVDVRPSPRPTGGGAAVRYDNGPADGWTIEKGPSSNAALDVVPSVGGTQLSFRYAVGGIASASPFAAAVMPAGPGLAGYTRLIFIGRADRPTRLSVQLRAPGGAAGERWHRSVFLDQRAREVTIDFADLRPRGATARALPDLAAVQSILFVADTVNTKIGTGGQVWIDDVRYGR